MFAASKTASVSGGYQISRSLRFNQADDTYLNRTPASAGTRTTWTWSAWIKRATISDFQYSVLAAGSGSNYDEFRLTTADKFRFFMVSGGSVVLDLLTTQVFRDPSAWYHFVVAYDSTQSTASNRAKLYVNGVQITALDTATYPAQNTNASINNNVEQRIGLSSSGFEYNGYMTEVNFIDGTQLTPSSFGETNAQTGVWQPKAYAGSYGTNGFYLNFSDNSNTTAATLGKDYSGNGNNWTPNNFSVTAGAGNDSLVDSPTSYGTDTGVGGTVRGNYSTLSPLYGGATGITNGNLDVTLSGGTQYGSMSLTTGKWYWEVTPTASLSGAYLGVMDSTFIKTDATWGTTTTSCYVDNGNKYGIGGTGAYGATYTTGDVIGFALDLDAGTMVFYKNGTSQGTASSGMTGREWRPMLYATGGTYACNFGQRPFAYTAPSGYKALCTQNLPTPTVGATTATQAGKYFGVTLRTGGAPSGGTYTTTVDMSNGALLWDKARNQAQDHYLVDSNRGLTKFLQTDLTNAESTQASWYTSFGNGTYSTGSTDWGSGVSLVDWIWAAGPNTTNTAGSITSTVSANTTSGFSIATFTSQASGTATVGHGLGVAPSMVIVKGRNVAYEWYTYHVSLGASAYVSLSSIAASAASTTLWNATSPTSSVFSLGTAWTGSNTFVAYCFAEVAGYSKFGSWTGNASTDGPFVFTGFRPAYVMWKRTDVANDWVIVDATRSTYNQTANVLYAEDPAAENTTGVGNSIDILSNGFKLRQTNNGSNASGGTYIFMAFATSPFKYSLAR